MKLNRIFIIDTFYPDYLNNLKNNHSLNFESRQELLKNSGFGTGSAYAKAFEKIGWEVFFSVPNDYHLQSAWIKESFNKKLIKFGWQYGPHIARLSNILKFILKVPHLHYVVKKQIEKFNPDLIFVQDINLLPPSFVTEIKSKNRVVVGEIASPLPPNAFLQSYDLIVTALPWVVDYCESIGVKSEWLPLGFDGDHADHNKNFKSRNYEAVFVGSITKLQKKTLPMLIAASKSKVEVSIFGPKKNYEILKKNGIGKLYKGEAWGNQMFKILGNSKCVLNRHGEIAKGYAVNMRMYEATGMGALLITDTTKGLESLFSVNDEILVYENVEELPEILNSLNSDLEKSEKIAKSGQLKTLKNHTYSQRCSDLVAVIEKNFQ